MFKRVEKRRRKKEEEEELGLNEDMKEVLGIHDTDSEESDSDSEQSSSEDDVLGEGDEVDEEGDLEGDLEEGSDDGGEESASGDGEPAITVQEALRDPVYLISLQPEVKGCITCPGKLLKGGGMVGIHRISKAHARRFKQFKALTEKASPTDNAWDIVRENTESKPKIVALAPISNSKRAEKREAKAAARKEQRQKQKAKAKAKKATLVQASTAPLSSRLKKKQKVEGPSLTTNASIAQPIETKKVPPTETMITNIVRSTSDRAKQARARASLKEPKTPVSV